ncbi:hypothetical protein Droror1_Dr00027232 [Drosera rotundifolia]
MLCAYVLSLPSTLLNRATCLCLYYLNLCFAEWVCFLSIINYDARLSLHHQFPDEDIFGGICIYLDSFLTHILFFAGKNFEKVCEMCRMTLNKVALCGENGTTCPGGVRIGTPATTTRGRIEADFETIADFLVRAAQITGIVQREHGKLQKGFLKGLIANKDIVELRNRVESFAMRFAMPGFDI